MDTTLLSEFDSFLSEVSLKLNNKQLLEQENASLKTEISNQSRIIEQMGTYLEAKQNEIAHLLKEKLYNSQRSTQSEYDTGKIMSLSDQASKLRYDLDISLTTIDSLKRELNVTRLENERLRLSNSGKHSQSKFVRASTKLN